MKLNDEEKKQLSTAIDNMNDALDVFIELYNESEEDVSIIEFEDQTIKAIKRAVDAYGKEAVSKKSIQLLQKFSLFLPKRKEVNHEIDKALDSIFKVAGFYPNVCYCVNDFNFVWHDDFLHRTEGVSYTF